MVQPVIMNSATCTTPACHQAADTMVDTVTDVAADVVDAAVVEVAAPATQSTLSQYLLAPSPNNTGIIADGGSGSDSCQLQALSQEDLQRLLARSPTEFFVSAPDVDNKAATVQFDAEQVVSVMGDGVVGEQLVSVMNEPTVAITQINVSGSTQDAMVETAGLTWNGDTLLNLAGLCLQASPDQHTLSGANQITPIMSCNASAVSVDDTCNVQLIGDSWPLQVVSSPVDGAGDTNTAMVRVVLEQTDPLDYSRKQHDERLDCGDDGKDESSASQALFSEMVASLSQTPKKQLTSVTNIDDSMSLNAAETSQLLGLFDDAITLSDAHMGAALIGDDDQASMISIKGEGVKHGDCCRCGILDFDS